MALCFENQSFLENPFRRLIYLKNNFNYPIDLRASDSCNNSNDGYSNFKRNRGGQRVTLISYCRSTKANNTSITCL